MVSACFADRTGGTSSCVDSGSRSVNETGLISLTVRNAWASTSPGSHISPFVRVTLPGGGSELYNINTTNL